MAIQVKTEEKVTRGDMLGVSPFDVVVKPELRGRHVAPDHAVIVERALSMLEYGQLQPVTARRDSEKRIVITAGFTRTEAAQLIRTGFEFEGQQYQDENFKLQVRIIECNDEDAFKQNVVENAHRNETSPVDDAHNQNRLRTQYNMNDAAISRLYGYTNQNKVGRLRKLLMLSTEQQAMVHKGTLTVKAALELLEVSEEDRSEVLAGATSEEGGVDVNEITEKAREARAARGQHTTRTIKEIRAFFETAKGESLSPDIREFSKSFLAYLNGKKGAQSLENAIDKLYNAEVVYEAEPKADAA